MVHLASTPLSATEYPAMAELKPSGNEAENLGPVSAPAQPDDSGRDRFVFVGGIVGMAAALIFLAFAPARKGPAWFAPPDAVTRPVATGSTDSWSGTTSGGTASSSSPTVRYWPVQPATSSYTPSSSSTYSGGGTVHVRGYYRKDGTYVAHTHAGQHGGTQAQRC